MNDLDCSNFVVHLKEGFKLNQAVHLASCKLLLGLVAETICGVCTP